MELGALILALINLVLAVLDGRRETRTQREAKAERTDAIDDVQQLNQAIRDKDADGVAAFFERERLEAWGRRTPPADRHGDGLHASRRDDSGPPPAGGQS